MAISTFSKKLQVEVHRNNLQPSG